MIPKPDQPQHRGVVFGFQFQRNVSVVTELVSPNQVKEVHQSCDVLPTAELLEDLEQNTQTDVTEPAHDSPQMRRECREGGREDGGGGGKEGGKEERGVGRQGSQRQVKHEAEEWKRSNLNEVSRSSGSRKMLEFGSREKRM
jgi:hypothetical protein